MDIVQRKVKRVAVAIAGGIVLVAGVVAIPYPGPGWLIVFAGLAILATEFEWARRLLKKARGEYDRWQQWLRNQPLVVRLAILLFTGIVVVSTMWLLNVFGMLETIFNIHLSWLHSPIGFFN